MILLHGKGALDFRSKPSRQKLRERTRQRRRRRRTMRCDAMRKKINERNNIDSDADDDYNADWQRAAAKDKSKSLRLATATLANCDALVRFGQTHRIGMRRHSFRVAFVEHNLMRLHLRPFTSVFLQPSVAETKNTSEQQQRATASN